jgi:methylated-DNA-[protein]-cysteine S-methyltransferase
MKRKKLSSSTDAFYDTFESPLGILYLLFAGKSLTSVKFRKPDKMIRRKNSVKQVARELQEYFEKGREMFTVKTTLEKGSAFDHKVWLTLTEIPYGETRTYKWLAEKVGSPNASRAVGQSLSRNPLPIILPCHRVIESDGSIGGYSAGSGIKRRLLDIEYYLKLEQHTRGQG